MSLDLYCPICCGSIILVGSPIGGYECPNCNQEFDSNGRYRKAASTNQRGSGQTSGQAGGGSACGTSPAVRAFANLSLTLTNPFLPRGVTSLVRYCVEPDRPALHREMAVGEIVGYRCWRVYGLQLVSAYMNDKWHPDQILEGKGLDDWDSRGVHAWKEDGTHLRACIKESFGFGGSVVIGTVYLWGDVVEHEHGYRAEFAKIRTLDDVRSSEWGVSYELECSFLRQLRERYHV